MKKHTNVASSLLLVVCMLISGMPIATPVVAVSADNQASEPINETLPGEAVAADTAVLYEDAVIVEEDTALRGEYEKHFLMSDGSYQVALYNEPIHKMEDGKWVEIDNTLTLKTATDGTARYTTTDGLADVSFSQSFDDQLITMQQDAYSVSWGVQAFSSSLSMNTTAKLVQPVQAELVTSDLSDFSVEEQKTLATKSSSTIQYRNALRQNVDLEYIVLPSRVKENIILQSAQDISYYVVTVYTENLSARLLENQEIEFYNDSDEVIFTMTSPYMYDSVGELSEDIAVEMVSKGNGCYLINMTPNAQWLTDESRVYPVVIDPQVSVDTTRNNIIDNYVLEGGGVQNRNLDRLYIGNRSEGRTRAFIQYAEMPTIPEGATITAATMTLTFTNGTDTASTASAYKVTGGEWASGTIQWSNMPAASTALATNISHNNLTGYTFSCKTAVQAWYNGDTTGQNANYGIMLRYYNENVADYNAIYSADYTNESKRPSLTIIYQYPTIADGVYRIKNANVGLYLGTYGGTAENTSVKLLGYATDGLALVQQLWSVRYLDNGYYAIRPIHKPDMALHVTSNNVDITTIGTTDSYDMVPGINRWTIESTSGGYYVNYAGTSSMAMRYANGAASPGMGVITAINSGTSSGFTWTFEKLTPPTSSNYLLNVEFSFDYGAISRFGASSNLSRSILNRNFLSAANAFAQKCGIYLINHQEEITPYSSDADNCPTSQYYFDECECTASCLLLFNDNPLLNNSSAGFPKSNHCKSITRLRNNLIVDIPDNTIRITHTGHAICFYAGEEGHDWESVGALSDYTYPIIGVRNSPTDSDFSPSTLAHEMSHLFGVGHHDYDENNPCIMSYDMERSWFDPDDVDTYWCSDCIEQIISQKTKY